VRLVSLVLQPRDHAVAIDLRTFGELVIGGSDLRERGVLARSPRFERSRKRLAFKSWFAVEMDDLLPLWAIAGLRMAKYAHAI